jgi:hypothetical protein
VGGGVLARILRGRWEEGLEPRKLGALVACGAASLVATLANPAGIRLHTYALGKAKQPMREFLTEWLPLDATTALGMAFLAVLLVLVTAIVLRGGFARVHHASLVFVVTYAALTCVRHVSFATIAIVLVTLRTWPEADGPILAWWRRARSAVARLPETALAGGVLALAAVYPPVVGGQPYYEPEDVRLPYELMAKVGDQIASHRTLNEYEFGAYLLWRLPHARSTFVDPRADHFIGEGVFKDYLAAWRAGPRVDKVLDQYRVDAVLLRPSTPLLQYVLATGRCTPAYADPRAVFAVCRAP